MYSIKKYAWCVILGIFIFHGILEDVIPMIQIFDECIAILCFPLAFFNYIGTKETKITKFVKYRRVQLGLLVIYILCGLVGNVLYQYQPFWIVAVSTVLSSKFFMILLSAGYIQKYLHLDLKETELAVETLSLMWFGYYILSLRFSNIFQQPTAWDVCAKSSLLFVLLMFCTHKRKWIYRLCLLLMITMLVLSGKEKAYGVILIFIILYYIVVHEKIQTKVRYILYMAVPVAMLAWDKIYLYYIYGQNKYPKSIMSNISFQIAKDYFPLGTGFGTYGSTYAASYYSPVYYLYGLAEHPVLGVESRMYLKDVFWPILFGETGFLGTLIYCLLIFVLFVRIQKIFYYSKEKYMLLIFMFIYLLITTFSEAGFMQPVVMVFAFVMGTLLEEYEEKRNYKMRYFREKE